MNRIVCGAMALGCVWISRLADAETSSATGPARAETAYAFCKAADTAIAAPQCELRCRDLVELARYLSVIDKAKARAILGLAVESLDAQLQKRREGMRPAEGSEEYLRLIAQPYSTQTRQYIELGGIAATVDAELARSYFLEARKRNLYIDDADDLFDAVIDSALLVLDGRERKAVRRAARFCQGERTKYVTFADSAQPSAQPMANALLWLDPDLAVKFADRFDAPDLKAHVLYRAIQWRLLTKTPPRVEWYEGLLMAVVKLADERRDNGLGGENGDRERLSLSSISPPPRFTKEKGYVRLALKGMPEVDIAKAVPPIERMKPGEMRDLVIGEFVPVLALHDFDRALKLTDLVKAENESEKRQIRSRPLMGVAKYDPSRLLDADEGPALLRSILPTSVGDQTVGGVFRTAAVTSAERGDMDAALQLLLLIEGASARKRAIGAVARVVADTDAERALSILDEAFRSALGLDRHAGAALSFAEQIAELEPEKGRGCLKEALDCTLARALETNQAAAWCNYSDFLERYAKRDPRGGLESVSAVPDLRFGRPRDNEHVVDPDVLPYLAVADPKKVYGFIEQLDMEPHDLKRLAYTIARRVAQTDPDAAEEFTGIIVEEEGIEYRTDWSSLHIEIAAWRTYHALLAGESDLQELRGALEQRRGKASDANCAGPLSSVFRTAGATNREQAIQAALVIPRPDVKERCLMALTMLQWEALDELHIFLQEYIESPTDRFQVWMRVGRSRVQQVPEWQIVRERELVRTDPGSPFQTFM